MRCKRQKITKTTTAAPTGREVPLVPRHSFSLWNRYDFTKPIGGGARGDRAIKILCDDQQCGEAACLCPRRRGALLQTAARHGGADQCRESVGAHYFPTANADNNIAPGAPRTVKATIGLSLLADEFLGPRLDSLQVAKEQCPLLALAVFLGDAEQEAGVDGNPALAAVGQARARRRGSCRSPWSCRTSYFAAVAPRATVTGGRISSRSCSNPPAASLDLARAGLCCGSASCRSARI